MENISTIYNTIKNLKHYINIVKNTKTFEDLDVLISEIKGYIYQNTELIEEFNKRIDIYKTTKLYKHYNYIGTIAYNSALTLRDSNKEYQEKVLANKTKQSLPDIGYFYLLEDVMTDKNNNINVYDSVARFYLENLNNHLYVYIDKNLTNPQLKDRADKILRNLKRVYAILGKEVINNIDFIALKFEDSVIYGRANIITNEFYPKWIKSALLGVLYELQNFMKIQVEDEEFKQKIQKKEIINQVLNSKFSNDLINIIKLLWIKPNRNCSNSDIANKLNLSTDTYDNRRKELLKLFGKTGERVSELCQCIDEYHITPADFN